MAIATTQVFLGDTPIPFYYIGEEQVGLFPQTQTSIPTNGLIYLFDATNVNSYPGSGSQWNDLTINRLAASPFSSSAFPTWDNTNKEFNFNGTNQALIANISSSIYTGSIIKDFTQIMWMKIPGTQGGDSRGTVGLQTSIGVTVFDSITWNDNTNAWRLQSNDNFRNAASVQTETVFNTYYMMSATRTSGTDNFKLYKDTSIIATGSFTPVTYTATVSSEVYSAFGQRLYNTAGTPNWASDGWWSGSLSSVILYNRALSDAEIAQIYNAGRTGITI
jgi:hypothetical protein